MKWCFNALEFRLSLWRWPEDKWKWDDYWRPRFIRDLTHSSFKELFIFEWLWSAGPFFVRVAWEEVPEWR